MPKKNPARRTPGKNPRRQPETLRLVGVTPSLTVTDIERSLAWYRDVLGFHVTDRWEAGPGKLYAVGLRAGNVTFILNQADSATGGDGKKGDGLQLYGNTRQNINRLAADITARGGVLASEPTDRPWGTGDFSLVDPDGCRFSVTTMGS